MDFLKLLKHKVSGGIKRLIIVFYKDAFPIKNSPKDDDLEKIALYSYCKGIGIDVGCGSKKTHQNALGIDVIPNGEVGKYGSEKRQISEADICASGDNLYMFANGALDYVVARHNLEHYENPMKTLKEWKRVLRKGGTLGVVLPDNAELDTLKIDPTHKYVFTKESFRKMLEMVGGFKLVKLETCVPKWSFVCVAEKIK